MASELGYLQRGRNTVYLKGFLSTFRKAAMLVLPKGEIYEVQAVWMGATATEPYHVS